MDQCNASSHHYMLSEIEVKHLFDSYYQYIYDNLEGSGVTQGFWSSKRLYAVSCNPCLKMSKAVEHLVYRD